MDEADLRLGILRSNAADLRRDTTRQEDTLHNNSSSRVLHRGSRAAEVLRQATCLGRDTRLLILM